MKHHAHETTYVFRIRLSNNRFTDHGSDLWRKISIYVCIPALLIAGVNAYNLYSAHQAHVAHEAHERAESGEEDETPEYPYQNIRVY